MRCTYLELLLKRNELEALLDEVDQRVELDVGGEFQAVGVSSVPFGLQSER